MHAPAGKMTRGRNEHRSMTLGDLAVLVAGVAVVLVLPSRQSYLPYPSDFLGPWPRWFPWCFCLRQALGAACIVVVPVVLWRRARYGGLARPAEFLALFAAMPFLADGIETGLIRFSYAVPAITALRDIRRPGPGRPSWPRVGKPGFGCHVVLDRRAHRADPRLFGRGPNGVPGRECPRARGSVARRDHPGCLRELVAMVHPTSIKLARRPVNDLS